MDHLHSTTTEHKKGKHLSYEERVVIQTRLKDGWTPNRIAREIGCAPNTVRNEIKRGTDKIKSTTEPDSLWKLDKVKKRLLFLLENSRESKDNSFKAYETS